jgi:hypothetical protein
VSRFLVRQELLDQTFRHFRQCGGGRRECQVLWISPWHSPGAITEVVHSRHCGRAGGFHVDDAWLNAFWVDLAWTGRGVRVQAHTHPFEAFHSETDDAFPIVQTTGFLSLVIPDFGTGAPSLERSFLAEISATGGWTVIEPRSRLTIMP